MNTENQIACSEHGEAIATYVCGHLVSKPAQRWFCDAPSKEEPWPDAWCPQCQLKFQEVGEWNEINESCLDLKLICNHCYENAIAQSVGSLEGDVQNSWIDAVAKCHGELTEKQARLEHDYSLSKHERWDFDQETSSLVFSNKGVAIVVADVEFIGSISTKSDTWLWSWANFNLLPNVRTRIKAVRSFGEANGFPHLCVPKWPADRVDGWEMSGIAVNVLGAQGVYRAPSDNGFLFMAIMNLRWAQ